MSVLQIPVVPDLSAADQALVETYRTVGMDVDSLPHTPGMTELVRLLGLRDDDICKHAVYRRLLHLRKAGLLP